MKPWRSLLASTALGAALAAGTLVAPASAQINLGGYTGPITMQYYNYETIINPTTGAIVPFTSVATGDQLVGVISISSIQNVTGSQTLWSQGGANGYLTGVFTGPTLTITGSNTFISTSSSTYNIYQNNTAPDFTQGTGGYAAAGGGCAVGGLCYNGITNAGGTLALSLVTTPGISSNASVYTTGSYDFSAVPPGGSYRFDLNVTGGSAASQFDTNGVVTALAGVFADFNVQGEFCTNSTVNCRGGITVGDWELLSTDPVTGNVIPEPSTLGLLGTALLGLGFIGWRSRRRA